jgi:acetyl-CoA acetyltransferase family protein
VLVREVYVVDAVRTPIGKVGGALAGVRPDDLAAAVLGGLVRRHPALDPATIDEVYVGAANQAGEDNRNVARMASLLAGLPVSVPGSTVNRLCASGLDALVMAARSIAVGDASLILVAGVESMTRAPWVLPKPDRAYPTADTGLASTTLGWRLVNPRMPERWTIGLGEATEQLARRYGITREAADRFAARSLCLAARAWADGAYDDGLVEVDGAVLDRDEAIRDGVTPETLARLRPAFRPDGIVTAGNASPLADGAAAVLLADDSGLAGLGVEPLARVRAVGVAAVEPPDFGIGPVPAVQRALAKAGRTRADVTALEINEAFAAQVLACLAEWPDIDPEVVNPLGGAVALGHPLGCSGARIAGALARRLAVAGSGIGVAALCVGVGQGVAVVMER